MECLYFSVLFLLLVFCFVMYLANKFLSLPSLVGMSRKPHVRFAELDDLFIRVAHFEAVLRLCCLVSSRPKRLSDVHV